MAQKTQPLFVSIMGTIGCGKTTAAKLLEKTFGWQFLAENFGDNAFLPRFYDDMPRWAFHSQTFFLMEKINQMLSVEGMLYEGSVVQDAPIYQDVFGYARAQHILGNMDEQEWKLYLKIFHSFEQYMQKPHLLIYLQTSVPVVLERIKRRGRVYEQEIPASYLSTLEKNNEEWIASAKGMKILTINTDDLNIVRSQKAKDTFLELVHTELKSL